MCACVRVRVCVRVILRFRIKFRRLTQAPVYHVIGIDVTKVTYLRLERGWPGGKQNGGADEEKRLRQFRIK